ncbi:hypothetical protein [Trichloromonas sp.]|uniref:hypothetical protein n=1 Tax=Trichloromonas sp. TaxID=3069249 RepID=UPI003D818887
MRYEIPREATSHLGIGKWVEIMESYDHREDTDSIQVKAMRVDSQVLAFSSHAKHETRPLRPHEGQITFIESGPTRTLFGIRLR